MLDKTYAPAEIEDRLYRQWEDSGVFGCDPDSDEKPFCIMIPPPNVTGSLHMGHALTFSIQDILIRYRRMNGRDALWQPGTDHAGIATQMVVERQLAAEGKTRHDLGREGFIERVWAWKAESGGAITRQLRRLGASLDWPRERFTMDKGLDLAVRKAFVTLHKEGLIYRDKRLVNWDPKLHTAISDLEVEQREVKGKMWHLRYPVKGEDGVYLTVATTRPETMLGDSGVAVHPDDERYKHLIGKCVVLPLVGREIPIVGDAYADPEKGTGAVKITPAHDFNDFEVGKRHNLELINVLDRDAHLNEVAPEAYRGLDRFVARERILADLEALGLLEKVEENPMTQPFGDRSGVVIEPWLTDQWFVDAAELAKDALAAVEDGRTKFVPENWTKTYYEWMRNIQPWCISRQIWWGHQVPAWYGPDGRIFVEMTEDEAKAAARAHYGEDVALTRDSDVLDTWFSSALWPFSTLGWPERTKELARYYPTDVLVTGFDIIFFWVARMMMMGLKFMGEVPFRTVYIHALVRDEKGQKMSKSKGNVIDPLGLIETYGADALRFTLAAMAAQGRDIKMSENRVQGYRNFATKLWNAARFCEMNECRLDPAFAPEAAAHAVNRWVVGKVAEAATAVTEALDAYKFNEAAGAIYQFVWGTFCDWYLEIAKPLLTGDDAALKAETRATAAWVLDETLKLLHPFMPYITEELWAKTAIAPRGQLIVESWPAVRAADAAATADVDWVVALIGAIRSARAEVNVPPSAKTQLVVQEADAESRRRLEAYAPVVERLARVEGISEGEGRPLKGAMQIVLGGATFAVPLAGVIDLDQEKARLAKELKRWDGEVERFDKKLANEKFVASAPEEIVAEQREKRAEALIQQEKVREALRRIETF
ncbi:valyl-tRNA synthetase [uncultured Alphaproteobacteria bacterium]|uniref:Valine--tRNA ligase n=1 Tax=uncultured Alphaproteobacteria bacterium TaxID=91750 RepID=A0A212J314_9PROT|nr:valyl-tRNA synthetase [uncultured Alphaproteobacteria bacterium]